MQRPVFIQGTFYFRGADNDWTSPQNTSLWQDAVKTLLDPCPAGWRVPKSGEGALSPWSAFTIGNSIWNGAAIDPSGGRTFDRTVVSGGTNSCWYPERGIRSNTGIIWYLDASYHWSSTMAGIIPYRLRFDAGKVVPDNTTSAGNCEGTSVRCIRE